MHLYKENSRKQPESTTIPNNHASAFGQTLQLTELSLCRFDVVMGSNALLSNFFPQRRPSGTSSITPRAPASALSQLNTTNKRYGVAPI